jgi:uncharacterized protein YjbI with pentapeptide repeats
MGLEINAIKEIKELKSGIGRESSAAEELSNGGDSIAISLLDLAEILDQHKIWVESGGESGVKADLCGVNLAKADLTGVNLQGAHLHRMNLEGADLSMANLRGASLVRSNLQNTNLLGTELRGANLMGANLYGAEGLWFGRLGGTNLFDAVLPESISAVDSSKAIGDATKVARWFYFLTVGASLLCCLLIGFTTDVRLLLNASALPFMRLGNVLPMTGLYLGGPLVLLALSLRFHFLLLRLWGSMAALPAVFPDGQTLGERWPVVPDGAGAQTLSVARGIAFGDDRVRNGAFDGAGVLDCSCDTVPLLASVPAAPGLPGNTAACLSDDTFGGNGDVSAFCCVASASAG